ncbi:MAG: hypothetical protein U0903_00150 [Planctomycetales bacterium]
MEWLTQLVSRSEIAARKRHEDDMAHNSTSLNHRWKKLTTAALLLAGVSSGCCSWGWRTAGRFAIPERLPLGSVNRAHYHAMQTNAEATDFVINLNEFEADTTQLTRDGRDHLLEVGARMRSAPFPVLVERCENNSNPELDSDRRVVVARYLAEMGNPDAEQRTIVGTPYSRGINSFEGEWDYYRQFGFRGTTFGNFNSGSQFGGFGGGGFGGWGGAGFF